jgi:TPR repeat protein
MSLLCLLEAGCQVAGVPVVTAMYLANVADQSTTHKRAEKLWDQQRSNVRELQARNDPMGDYLYALGNAQGWIGDTSDPLQIRDLLEKAAKEGSSDAQIMLGSFYLTGVVPSHILRSHVIWLPHEVMNSQLGERLLREGMQVRCTYAEPVVDAYSNRTYLRYVSGAAWIWPAYRDGRNALDAAGNYYPLLNKDERLAAEWKELDRQCNSSGATTE